MIEPDDVDNMPDEERYAVTADKPCYDCGQPTFAHFDLEDRCEDCYLSLK